MNCGTSSHCAEILVQLLIIGLTNGAVIALNAIGVTLVYGAVRTLNFAHGDLFALATVLVNSLILLLGLQQGMALTTTIGGLLLILVLVMILGALLNLGIERIAFRPFRGRSRLAPLIATLGLSFILFQAALIWRRFEPSFIPREHRSVPGLPEVPKGGIPEVLPDLNLIHAAGLNWDVSFTLKDALVLVLALGCALGVSWLLRRTKIGRSIRACAQNPELAQLCGVNLPHAIRMAFALGGALAGAAALIFTVYYTHPLGYHGAQSGLIAFAAAILGGVGRPGGAFVSGLVLGLLASFGDYFGVAQWTPVLVQVVLVLLLVLRPTGLMPEEGSQELASQSSGDVIATVYRGRSDRRSRVLAWGLFALGIVYPLLDSTLGINKQTVFTNILIFVLLALGLNLLLGAAGLLDLGYAASFGIGSYVAVIIINPYGPLGSQLPQPVDFLVVLAASALAAGLFGALNGLLAIRLRRDYLAIVTLALGQMIPQIVLNLDAWTGGVGGIGGLPTPQIFTHPLQAPVEKYYLAFGVVVLAAVASQRLTRSRIGRAWMAMAADEVAAASYGVNLARAKTVVFMLSTAAAGIAGALYAGTFSYIDTDQISFQLSAMVLAMVIIGGAGSVPGACIGALTIASYDRLVIPMVGALIDPFRAVDPTGILATFDVRGLSSLSFGLALYLTVLLRARRRRE